MAIQYNCNYKIFMTRIVDLDNWKHGGDQKYWHYFRPIYL